MKGEWYMSKAFGKYVTWVHISESEHNVLKLPTSTFTTGPCSLESVRI